MIYVRLTQSNETCLQQEILNLELLLNNKLHKQHHSAFQTLNDDVRILLKQSLSNLNSFILTRYHVSFSIKHVCIKIMSL